MECIFCSKSAKLIREICSLSRNVLFSSKHNWKTDAAVQWILPEFSSFENNAARCSRSRAFQNGCMRREGTRKTGGVPFTRNGGRFVRQQITTKIGSVLANRTWLIMLFIIQLHKLEYSWRANRAQTRLFGRLVYIKKNLFNQSGARATLLYPLCFSHLMRNEQNDLAKPRSSWKINDLLDVLACSIAEYFYYLLVFWLALQAQLVNTAHLVKVLSDTSHQNV